MLEFYSIKIYIDSIDIYYSNSYCVPATQGLQALMKGMAINMEALNKVGFIQVSPYDDSAWDHYSMYDNTPYVWNSDLNSMNIFTLVTGNLIKAGRCIIKDPYEIKHS